MKKLVIVFSALALAVASAATNYRVKLYEPSMIGGTLLKPGEYKVEVKDNRVSIKDGKTVAEADVRVENADQKFSTTTVRYGNTDGKLNIQEIKLGGTTTKLVFTSAPNAGN